MSEERNKKSLNVNFFSRRKQFRFVGISVADTVYCMRMALLKTALLQLQVIKEGIFGLDNDSQKHTHLDNIVRLILSWLDQIYTI